MRVFYKNDEVTCTNQDDYFEIVLNNVYEEKSGPKTHLLFRISGSDTFSDIIDMDNLPIIFDQEDFFELTELYIHPKNRLKGFGNKLMKNFIEILNTKFPLSNCFLYAKPYDNALSLPLLKKFYGKYGFEEIDIDPDCLFIEGYRNNYMMREPNS